VSLLCCPPPSPSHSCTRALHASGARDWRCTRRSMWAWRRARRRRRRGRYVLFSCNTRPFLPGARAWSYFTPPPPASSW
jgi:hypothetical protein